MREILFRGKREDNGNWIQGSLFTRINDAYIIPLPTITSKSKVDPDTVGQFTGLTDKNGKKIFEGDIVDALDIFGHWDGSGIVNWNETFNGWYMGKSSMYCDRIATYEVIGNIHDNPELIERYRL